MKVLFHFHCWSLIDWLVFNTNSSSISAIAGHWDNYFFTHSNLYKNLNPHGSDPIDLKVHNWHKLASLCMKIMIKASAQAS